MFSPQYTEYVTIQYMFKIVRTRMDIKERHYYVLEGSNNKDILMFIRIEK